jgi:PhoPQ-activated pathogenicity-related protein
MPRQANRFAACLSGLALTAGVISPPAHAQAIQSEPDSDAATHALADYVAKPDASYQWQVRGRYRYRGSELVELRLVSQTWRDVVWKHQLILIRPPHVADDDRGLLIIGGGRWQDSYDTEPAAASLPEGGRLFVAIARRLETVVAVLGEVPFQPLFDRNEDGLIAYTFDQYLKTGDPEWPLLLPMVKSAVRAMDAVTEATEREWDTPVSQFTVLGGSKRAWTTWLTAAQDRRVTALAPVVLDALNMEQHFPYQTRTWGSPSEEIEPYTSLNLPDSMNSIQMWSTAASLSILDSKRDADALRAIRTQSGSGSVEAAVFDPDQLYAGTLTERVNRVVQTIRQQAARITY